MPELWVIITYLVLGAFVGFFAGLLGIGGGGIIVPVLTTVFLMQHFPYESVVHMALATSMTTIIFTSISSIYAQHKRGAILWSVVKQIAVGVVIGTSITSLFVSTINTKPLALIFTVLMAVIAVQMALNKKPKPSRQLPSFTGMSFVGAFIGSISALIAIGGGSLSVPFLTWCNTPIKKAIATSSAIGFIIALSGSLTYMLNTPEVSLPHGSFGYVYWPAVLLIAGVSIFTAPIGVKVAHLLPVVLLKRIFSVLLLLLSLKMFTSL